MDSETRLQYSRARYYDSSIGRFISEDPVDFDGGINFYGYVANNPTNLVDPSGYSPAWWDAIVNWLFPPKPKAPTAIRPFKCTKKEECDFTPEMQQAPDCFRNCVGKEPTITCGRGRHKDTDPHMKGLAADLGRGTNPWLTRDQAKKCFSSCFPKTSYAQEEWNSPPTNTHFHIQYSPGRGGASGFAPVIKGDGR